MKTLHQTACTATRQARNGSVRSADGLLDLRFAMPKERGGAGGAANPEQLFAAGYAACFTSPLLRIARDGRTNIGKPSVTAHAGLRSDGENRFARLARIEVALPDVDRGNALALARGAHRLCPFSKAVAESLGVSVTLTDRQDAQGAVLAVEG